MDQADGEVLQKQTMEPIPTIRVDEIYVSEDDVFHSQLLIYRPFFAHLLVTI